MVRDRKFDDFDKFSENYRNEHTKNIQKVSGVDSNYFSEYKIREISQNEKASHDSVILDFGCGDGNSAYYFSKHLFPKAYYGIDISINCIKEAEQRPLENCDFRIFDGAHIPFENGTFDIILIACVLHHVDSSFHNNILRECHRVLKDEGRLYIFEHNPINPLTRRLVDTCPFDKDAVLIHSRELKKPLKEILFVNIKRKYTIFFPRKYFFKRLVFLEKYLSWCPLGGQYYIRCEK